MMSDDWDPVSHEELVSITEPQAKRPSNADAVEALIEKLLAELNAAYVAPYDPDKAERTAAAFLTAQFELARFISSVEVRARNLKRDVERVSAETYYKYKDSATDRKLTEVAINQLVSKDPAVLDAKSEHNEADAETKKWNLVFGILRDGHYFFRNVAKHKGEL